MSRAFGVAALLALATPVAAERGDGASYVDTASTAPVIGGTAVPAGKWPDAVAVLGAQGACTGTLIAPARWPSRCTGA